MAQLDVSFGDQEVAGSPFCLFKKGSCQFLVKECA